MTCLALWLLHSCITNSCLLGKPVDIYTVPLLARVRIPNPLIGYSLTHGGVLSVSSFGLKITVTWHEAWDSFVKNQ